MASMNLDGSFIYCGSSYYAILEFLTLILSKSFLNFFSHDGKYISAGSENQCVFLWRTHYEPNNLTVRKDRNSYYEAIKGKIKTWRDRPVGCLVKVLCLFMPRHQTILSTLILEKCDTLPTAAAAIDYISKTRSLLHTCHRCQLHSF